MTAKFSSGEPPDLFYVDSSVAPEWIDEEVLVDLEPLAAERGFDTSAVLSWLPRRVPRPRRRDLRLPEGREHPGDGLQHRPVEAAGVEPPTDWAGLTAAAEALTTATSRRSA